MSSSSKPSVRTPAVTEMLVTLFDWARFHSLARKHDSTTVFRLLDDFYKLSEEIVHAANGRIIKFMGDAGLAVFAKEHADQGIVALLALKQKFDERMRTSRIDSQLHVNCHFGEVTIGPIGGPDTERLDIIGETVNICFSLEHKGVTLTPQAFRCLSAENRKLFKKYTPPIVYRSADQRPAS